MKIWYRVAGFGFGGGCAKRTSEAAWQSAWRHVPESDRGTFANAHNLMLYGATTKRAAERACVSEVYGKIGRGRFWRIV